VAAGVFNPTDRLLSSKPFGNAAVMGACPSAALAETVSSICALRCRALRDCGTVFRTLNGFALAVCVGAIVGAFWFLLLLVAWLVCRGLLRSLRERWKQYRRQRENGNDSAHERHRNLLFRLSGEPTPRGRGPKTVGSMRPNRLDHNQAPEPVIHLRVLLSSLHAFPQGVGVH
jgi:hypothetical protein